MKTVKILLISAVTLAVVALAVFELFFRSAVPGYTGEIILEALESEVEVRTDEYGVPHIFADNETDLFFAQGYITARERLFQMEITRLSGRGELSTLFGEATIDSDRFLRTLGIHRMADESYNSMSDEARRKIDAYVSGINAFIESGETIPREFTLLRAKPGKWDGTDSVAAGLLMAFSLTRSLHVGLALYRILEQAGEEITDFIAPHYPEFAPTLTGQNLAQRPERVFHLFPSKPLEDSPDIAALPILQSEFPASNWMIFSGELTKSGKPLFAGSPDLEPTLPALFYMMRLNGGRYDVAGGALPGVPGIGPLGFNGDFAWSAVNGRWDELDYFVEKPNPDNPLQYRTEDEYQDFTLIDETIRIKDGSGYREKNLQVKVSRHGPIISDVMPMAPKNTAMKWSAFDNASTDIEGLLRMNRAGNFDEFRDALSYVRTINLGFGYADRNGNIGWQFTGSPPLRAKGDGSLPVPGWPDDYAWTGYVPFDQLPYDFNPDTGYIASFNNDPGNSPHYFTGYYLFQRAIRFDQLIEERGGRKVSLDELHEMQLDTKSPVAELWTPLILDAGLGEEMAPYAELLRNWNYKMDLDSRAAPLFALFYARMMKNTVSDVTGEKLWNEGLSQSYLVYIPDLVLTKVAHQPDHFIYNDTRTEQAEDRDAIIRKSMSEAVKQLISLQGPDPEEWSWGRGHKMYFEHPLGERVGLFNLGPIPTPGDHFTINSGFWELGDPFRMDSGGVIRIAVDFAAPENSSIISPPGQSGHYRSPHYDDLAKPWARGEQIPLRFESGKKVSRILLLKPGR